MDERRGAACFEGVCAAPGVVYTLLQPVISMERRARFRRRIYSKISGGFFSNKSTTRFAVSVSMYNLKNRLFYNYKKPI